MKTDVRSWNVGEAKTPLIDPTTQVAFDPSACPATPTSAVWQDDPVKPSWGVSYCHDGHWNKVQYYCCPAQRPGNTAVVGGGRPIERAP